MLNMTALLLGAICCTYPAKLQMHDVDEVVLLYCLLLIYEHSKASSRSTFQHTVTLVYLLEIQTVQYKYVSFGFTINIYQVV